MSRILLAIALTIPSIAFSETFDIDVPGYSAPVGAHMAKGDDKKIIVISLHGKEKGREHEHNIAFANQLASKGYTTYTPEMPWYGYKAPVSTVYAFLDALIKKVGDGKKVVVAGHSQGAPYALFYTTDHQPPVNVAGSVLLAPGHLVHRSLSIQKMTKESVERARDMVANGKGDVKAEFEDLNKGGGIGNKTVNTTANIYLTYFDPETSPDFTKLITRARLPILWLDGANDGLAQRMNYAGIFSTAASHPQNKHIVISGGHVSMWGNASDPVAEWLQNFK